ncbi:MAG TPA: fumarylacetoacetate hydrolase family protein [Natronosporangium sp.]|nr:fumarylacetoacetate hydrolase family protein [Natronosporangium sp.]
MTVDIDALADRLAEAAQRAQPIPQLTSEVPLTVEDAYRVQAALVQRRLAAGQRLTGIKLGLTSQAKMAQMGVNEVIWGRLTDDLAIADGGTVDTRTRIHPRVEPEVAFQLDASGAPVAVAAALEVIDSRYADFRFTLADVVADNTSAAGYVLGPWRPLPVGLENLGVLLEVNGEVVQTGSTAAILGDPRRALAQGLRLAAQAGLTPQAGWVLLAGAATAAVPLTPGSHVRAVVEHLGTASVEAA